MSDFDSVVNKETVASFGIDMSVWDDHLQRSLYEAMILAWKENPEWTEEEAKKGCREQAMLIYYGWFKENLGFLVKHCNYWRSLEVAFQEFCETTLKNFIWKINEQMEFNRFCQLFYDELRERYNICSAGMEDEFVFMKKNNWTFSDYRKYLKKQK